MNIESQSDPSDIDIYSNIPYFESISKKVEFKDNSLSNFKKGDIFIRLYSGKNKSCYFNQLCNTFINFDKYNYVRLSRDIYNRYWAILSIKNCELCSFIRITHCNRYRMFKKEWHDLPDGKYNFTNNYFINRDYMFFEISKVYGCIKTRNNWEMNDIYVNYSSFMQAFMDLQKDIKDKISIKINFKFNSIIAEIETTGNLWSFNNLRWKGNLNNWEDWSDGFLLINSIHEGFENIKNKKFKPKDGLEQYLEETNDKQKSLDNLKNKESDGFEKDKK